MLHSRQAVNENRRKRTAWPEMGRKLPNAARQGKITASLLPVAGMLWLTKV